jgi:cytidylate kinase
VADAAPVREAMKRIQRRMAQGIDVVTEGRDQGSVVFPQAEVKVFVTASAEERARRRHDEELARGNGMSFAEVLTAQAARDEGDRSRAVGPMRAADDAVILETDGLTRDDVVARLVALVEARRRGDAGP